MTPVPARVYRFVGEWLKHSPSDSTWELCRKLVRMIECNGLPGARKMYEIDGRSQYCSASTKATYDKMINLIDLWIKEEAEGVPA